MTDTQVEGIVKFLKKDKKGVCLEDGKWYSNGFLKEDLNCKKGDKVKLTLNVKGFLMSMEVLQASPSASTSTSIDHRLEVDSGNCLQRAVELVIAGKYDQVKTNGLMEATLEVCAAFRAAKEELSRELNKEVEEKSSLLNKSEEI